MFEFDLQRFDDDTAAQVVSTEQATAPEEEKEPIPAELAGLPEDIARETMEEWERMQSKEPEQDETPTDTGKQYGSVPYDRFKAKVDEANQLKAQLAQYQQQHPQQPPLPPQQQMPQMPVQIPQIPLPEIKITPEISQKINSVIETEAMRMSGLTKEDIEELEFVDKDDPRVSQWEQSKRFATNHVLSAIQQERLNRQFQAQQAINTQFAAVQTFNAYASKEMAEPDFKEIQNYAVNDFFSSLTPTEKEIFATSYQKVAMNIASPPEMMVVKNYFERAKSEYRATHGRKGKKSAQRQPPAMQLPRTDNITGMATTVDGQLSARDIEKLLEQDFTTIDPIKQKIMLGLS